MQLERREKQMTVSDSLLAVLLDHYGETIYAGQARALYARASRNSKGELAYTEAYTTLSDYMISEAYGVSA